MAAHPVLRIFTALLKLCAAQADLADATSRAVHVQLAARGLASKSLTATALANMYFKCCRPIDARRVFDQMPARDCIAWNAHVAWYAGGRRGALDSVALVSVLHVNVRNCEL